MYEVHVPRNNISLTIKLIFIETLEMLRLKAGEHCSDRMHDDISSFLSNTVALKRMAVSVRG